MVDNAIGSALYARCADYDYGDPTTWRSDCGPYRTTDFEHWTMGGPDDVRLDFGGDLDGCPKDVSHGSRSYLSVLRIGEVFYGIAHLRYLNGREVRNLGQVEIDDPDEPFRPHLVRHVIEKSTDRCRHGLRFPSRALGLPGRPTGRRERASAVYFNCGLPSEQAMPYGERSDGTRDAGGLRWTA